MRKHYFFNSLLIVLFTITVGCDMFQQGPTRSIQFEIEETNVSVAEKNRAITNLQKRLQLLGARDISVSEQEAQRITFNYRGTIKLAVLKSSLSIVGKLEFFETCKDKAVLKSYLVETFREQLASDLDSMTYREQFEALYGFLGMYEEQTNYGYSPPNLGFVSEKNIEKLRNALLNKTFFVSQLNTHVKFLLSKDSHNGFYEVYPVCITANNKAPLDGSYITEVGVEKGNFEDRYDVSIQMNDEGATIWEAITDHAYRTQGNIAVVIDDEVYSAPSVLAGKISGGSTVISGDMTKLQAMDIANAIRSGNIPKVEILQTTTLKETF